MPRNKNLPRRYGGYSSVASDLYRYISSIAGAARRSGPSTPLLPAFGQPILPRTPRRVRNNPGPVYVGTPSGPQQRARRRGAATSKSMGFLYTKSKARPKKRKVSKKKLVTRAQITRYGTYKTVENGDVLTSTHVRYIGHTTHPADQIWNQISKALVKRIAISVGMEVNDFEKTIVASAIGDQWQIRYRTSWDATATLSSHTFISTAVYSLGDVAFDFVTWLIANWNNQYNIDGMTFIPTTGSKYPLKIINLKQALVHVDIKSTLKIQNRTVNAEGDDSNDVDNAPLYGRGYYGNGNGTQYNDNTVGTVPFVGDKDTGVISKDAGASVSLREPPFANMFVSCKQQGKIHLDPGQIKTSVLTYKKTTLLNSLMRQTVMNNSTIGRLYTTSGQFRFFGLEKMIDATSDPLSIIVAYEHNYLIGLAIQPLNNTITSSEFQTI